MLLGLGVLFLGLAGCGGTRSAPPIVIGHAAPRTGPQRELGLHAEEAIRLAIEDVKAGEPLLPGRAVEVRHADSEGSAETAQNIAVRLVSVNHAVALIGSADPGAAERLCRIGQQYKVPVLTAVWLPVAVLGTHGFGIGPTPAEQGKALGRFAAQHLKATIVLLVDNRSPAFLARAEAFAESIGKERVARRDEFASEDELTELTRAVKAAQAAAVFFAGKPGDLDKLHTELREAGARDPLTFLYGGDEEPRLAVLADRWSGTSDLYWTTAFVADDAPAAREFVRKYRERYQRLPDADAALAYDAARLLFEAIRQARTARPDRVREELAKLKDFPTLTGPASFAQNQLTPRPAFVVSRQNGQFKSFRSAPPAAKGEASAPPK
jgi:branched-chain amino acid transport system substrate-binding protein